MCTVQHTNQHQYHPPSRTNYWTVVGRGGCSWAAHNHSTLLVAISCATGLPACIDLTNALQRTGIITVTLGKQESDPSIHPPAPTFYSLSFQDIACNAVPFYCVSLSLAGRSAIKGEGRCGIGDFFHMPSAFRLL